MPDVFAGGSACRDHTYMATAAGGIFFEMINGYQVWDLWPWCW